MTKLKNKKGFTLIEMLVVIAIIAILVAIVIPTVSNATRKAKAAADAANLRSLQGVANTALMNNGKEGAAQVARDYQISCATFPGAEAAIYYEDPGFLYVCFATGGTQAAYYGLDYFVEVAETGKSDKVSSTIPSGERFNVQAGS